MPKVKQQKNRATDSSAFINVKDGQQGGAYGSYGAVSVDWEPEQLYQKGGVRGAGPQEKKRRFSLKMCVAMALCTAGAVFLVSFLVRQRAASADGILMDVTGGAGSGPVVVADASKSVASSSDQKAAAPKAAAPKAAAPVKADDDKAKAVAAAKAKAKQVADAKAEQEKEAAKAQAAKEAAAAKLKAQQAAAAEKAAAEAKAEADAMKAKADAMVKDAISSLSDLEEGADHQYKKLKTRQENIRQWENYTPKEWLDKPQAKAHQLAEKARQWADDLEKQADSDSDALRKQAKSLKGGPGADRARDLRTVARDEKMAADALKNRVDNMFKGKWDSKQDKKSTKYFDWTQFASGNDGGVDYSKYMSAGDPGSATGAFDYSKYLQGGGQAGGFDYSKYMSGGGQDGQGGSFDYSKYVQGSNGAFNKQKASFEPPVSLPRSVINCKKGTKDYLGCCLQAVCGSDFAAVMSSGQASAGTHVADCLGHATTEAEQQACFPGGLKNTATNNLQVCMECNDCIATPDDHQKNGLCKAYDAKRVDVMHYG